MKTSQSQFEILVTYMEQHGDLYKVATNAQSRITCIQNWEELTALLNSHGNNKTTEKWRKAWSDFKNNTKKKFARLQREASGTGRGPAVFAKLSDLEQRVLNLMGLQVATGLAVEKAALPQEVHIQLSSNNDVKQGILTLHQFEESSDSQNENLVKTITISTLSPPPPPFLRAISSPPLLFVEQEVENDPLTGSGTSSLSITPAHSPPVASPTTMATSQHSTLVEPQVEETGLPSPTRPSTHVRVGNGVAPSVQTTPYRARRTQGSPRRRARPAHTEQVAQHFWRKFKKQQHRDNIELKREQNRIRELEVEVQRGWQAIGGRVVNILEKLADKYCKD